MVSLSPIFFTAYQFFKKTTDNHIDAIVHSLEFVIMATFRDARKVPNAHFLSIDSIITLNKCKTTLFGLNM